MSKGKELGEQVLSAVKGYVARSIVSVVERLDAIEQRLKEVPPKGEKGEDGRSVTIDDVRPLIEEAVKALPVPKDGRDGENGTSVTLDDVRPLIEQAVKAIPAPKDGKDGENGKSITADDVLPALKTELQKAVEALPIPKDGRDGIDGKDGASVTVEDFRQMFEAEQAKWTVGFERYANDFMQRCIDRIPAPKDGKDGSDGLGFEDLEVQHDGERTFTVRFVRGEKVKEFAFKVPVLIERGVYRAGQTYERGDGVTRDGSFWVAQKETSAKPGESPDWRMAVKKGRDGKDGERGIKGEPGQKGRDGRDFSQVAFPGVR
jgi:hypothetical protein